MEETLKDLDMALKLISLLNVSGDAVDYVAVAKNSIRKARADIAKMMEPAEQSDGVTNT